MQEEAAHIQMIEYNHMRTKHASQAHLMFLYIIRCNIISMIFVLLLVVHSAVCCAAHQKGDATQIERVIK